MEQRDLAECSEFIRRTLRGETTATDAGHFVGRLVRGQLTGVESAAMLMVAGEQDTPLESLISELHLILRRLEDSSSLASSSNRMPADTDQRDVRRQVKELWEKGGSPSGMAKVLGVMSADVDKAVKELIADNVIQKHCLGLCGRFVEDNKYDHCSSCREKFDVSRSLRHALEEVGVTISPYQEGWLPSFFPHHTIMQFLLTLPFRARHWLFGQKIVEREAVSLTGRGLFEFSCALALRLPRRDAPQLLDDIGFGWSIADEYGDELTRDQIDALLAKEYPSFWSKIVRVRRIKNTRWAPGLALPNLYNTFVRKPRCHISDATFRTCFGDLLWSFEKWKSWDDDFEEVFPEAATPRLYAADDVILALTYYYALGIMMGWKNPAIARRLIADRLGMGGQAVKIGLGGLAIDQTQHYRSVQEACDRAQDSYQTHGRLFDV